MRAEQVVKAAIMKQSKGFSYEDIAFRRRPMSRERMSANPVGENSVSKLSII
jgi:hypothetical protein